MDWITLIKTFDRVELAYQADDAATILRELHALVPEYNSSYIVSTVANGE